MNDNVESACDLPSWQQAIKSKCIHPTGIFTKFSTKELEQSVSSRFEERVLEHPERLAIKSTHQVLTYLELNKSANRIGHAVLARLVGGYGSVALLFSQGISMIVAIIGALKTGKIYVPLDASYPPRTIVHMMEDSGARMIITDTTNLSLARRLSKNEIPIVNVDLLEVDRSCENLNLPIFPNTLAGIYYTSGSTGKPKGVVLNNRNIMHRTMIYTNDFHICPDDRQSFFYSCGVSASVRHIFGALLNGALLLPTSFTDHKLANIPTWFDKEGITIYASIPTLFRHFIDTMHEDNPLPRLRLIYLSSEPVTLSDVALYKQQFSPDCILVNQLATSETGSVRQYFIDKEVEIGDTVPVGYQMEGKQLLLLDEAGEIIDTDQAGEIAIKSQYLSPGYWRQPGLTRARFIGDGSYPCERTFRTGDLGRLLPDGCLLHIGRKDLKVKISGHHVDLGEVESAIKLIDQVKDAAASTYELRPGALRIVAYIVPKSPGSVFNNIVRRHLRKTLPAYMVPTAFVELDALPLTPNGKLDRKALPQPEFERSGVAQPLLAPRDNLEKVLTGIWAEVLDLEYVDIHDDFLDLGGDSLDAQKIYSRLVEVFGVRISIIDFFKASTISEIARLVDSASPAQPPSKEYFSE